MTCRVCVVETANVINIFEEETSKYHISKTIHQHLRFLPLPDDPISTIICLSCWKRIEEFHDYYLSVENAQERFADLWLEAVKPPLNIEDIKEEFKIEPIEAVLMNGEVPENILEEVCPKDEIDLKEESDSNTFNDCKNDADSQQSFSLHDSYLDGDSKVQHEAATTTTKAATKKSTKGVKKTKPVAQETKRKSEIKRTAPRLNLDEMIAKQTSLRCDLCPNEFLTFDLLQKHYRKVHDVRGYVVCCLKKFRTRSKFADHLLAKHKNERPTCEICKKSYINRQGLKQHMEIKHSSIEDQIYHCEKCPKRFMKQYSLNEHLKTHEPSYSAGFSCEECGNSYKTSLSLTTHRRRIHDLAYTVMCDICAKVFRGRESLETHKITHADVPPPRLECPKCKRSYKNALLLKRHIRNHEIHDGKEYICNFCGKHAPSFAALKSHRRYRHLVQRTHKCTLCDGAFKDKITLKEHMAIHTGASLYACPYCSRTSNSKSNMYAHRKRMHPEEWAKAKKLQAIPTPEN